MWRTRNPASNSVGKHKSKHIGKSAELGLAGYPLGRLGGHGWRTARFYMTTAAATVEAEPTEPRRKEKLTRDRFYPETRTSCEPSMDMFVLASFHFKRPGL